MNDFSQTLDRARVISRRHFGRRITFYHPGSIRQNGKKGRYPAVSITGKHCTLKCDHCGGVLLQSMIPAETPEVLIEKCLGLFAKGNFGVLITGGCDDGARLPWKNYLGAIETIKNKTDLHISIHCGIVDEAMARDLKTAGVDQALIDVIDADDTYRRVYHVDFGTHRIRSSLEALLKAGLETIPHIVCGLHYGRIKGEFGALETISGFDIDRIVVVSLMKIPGTPMAGVTLPSPESVARVIAEARMKMPRVHIGLGCARERGNERLEILSIDAGVNSLALPSDEAVAYARACGLFLQYQPTCCSVPERAVVSPER